MGVLNLKENGVWKELQTIKGADGHTPEKGVDYFTEEDIASLNIPEKVSDLPNDAGYTTNEGTITSIKMNGNTISTSGEADLGTVITAHQDISGKVDKIPDKGLSENDFTDADKANLDSNTATRHTHTNKSILDVITAAYTTVDKANLDNNTSARHTHTNKSTIDGITSSDIENWNNKVDQSDLDGYATQAEFQTVKNSINTEKARIDKLNTDLDDVISYVDEVSESVPTELSQLSEDSTHRVVTDTEKTAWNNKQNAIDSSHKLSSDLVDDTNQTNLFVTSTEKTTWNDKADEGFTGIITGTSANPTDGASLPNGVYKADESKAISYINLLMEDGTTKRQSVQKGGIVIRTTARLLIFATQNLMYQYDTSEHYFYEPESFVESWIRSTANDGYVDIGTLSSPNNKIVIGDIYSLEGTVTAGDVNHVKLIFKVVDNLEGEPFEFNLTTSDSEPLLFEDGAVPEFKAGMTYILDFYGHNCEIVGFKESGTLTKDALLKQFMRQNSNVIYYPSLDGKPSVTVQSAKGSTDEGRPVVMEYSEPFLTNFQDVEYYGIPKFIPLDLSLYDTSKQANQLHPHTQLPDGNYWVKSPGKMYVGGEPYTLVGKELIYKNGDVLAINGGEYTAAYYAWDSTENDYKGGFFTTYQDVMDAISEINYEPGLTVVRQTNTTGTTTVNNGKWNKRVNNVNSMTLAMANLTEIPDTFKARVTVQTSATFTTFSISQRTAFKVYFAGWDCTNGVLAGKPNAFYNIDYRADGKGNVVAMVTGYDVPTT